MTERRVDFLVVGSGIAGLWFSYRASRVGEVLVITKKADSESNTNYAQGGIAAAVAEDDEARLHYEDTIRAGHGLGHPDVAKAVTESGPALVRELYELGVPFNTYLDSGGHRRFDLGQEGGHHRRRIVNARDYTGLEIEKGLLKAAESGRVTVLQEHFTIDLALDEHGSCRGAYILDKVRNEVMLVRASVCLLAAGGIGQAYLHTTNPRIATGDGIAMGFRAGARIANMEFIQFHPTSLCGRLLDDRAFLVSEAVRGEGAILRTRDGHAFMDRYHPDAGLAPRDVVARAIASELEKRGEEYVLLDATHLDPAKLRDRFPLIYKTCLDLGIDMLHESIPVVPAAHYVCGGVATNIWGETSVPGLFAAGECACSGLHGANRLASNSLLEALVMADRAALRAGEVVKRSSSSPAAPEMPVRTATVDSGGPDDILARLRRLMWQRAGIVRTDQGLSSAAQELGELCREAGPYLDDRSVPAMELRNLLAVSRLVVECALRRPESRGLHFNQDHPEQDDRYRKDTLVAKTDFEAGFGCGS